MADFGFQIADFRALISVRRLFHPKFHAAIYNLGILNAESEI
jgi:hypothetical protein